VRTMLDWLVGGGRLADVVGFAAGVVEGRDEAASSSRESSLSSAGASWDAK
jgi:hypothetical protein